MPDDTARISRPDMADPPAAARARCARGEHDAMARAQRLELIKTLARECAKRDHDAESP
ncbi:MAG: hypothetical protein IKD61_01215 [Oscillospiraceae bacterium]|nr:hypothetical protein [Oscillospiraceae bacterium]